jgi:hypothetical protein
MATTITSTEVAKDAAQRMKNDILKYKHEHTMLVRLGPRQRKRVVNSAAFRHDYWTHLRQLAFNVLAGNIRLTAAQKATLKPRKLMLGRIGRTSKTVSRHWCKTGNGIPLCQKLASFALTWLGTT